MRERGGGDTRGKRKITLSLNKRLIKEDKRKEIYRHM